MGEPQIGEILREMGVGFPFEITSLMRKDSLDMDEADRQLVRQAVERESCKRILVTHGTDTMVETGKALVGISGKVIVLTGAMEPAHFKSSDAVFNVGVAVGALNSLPGTPPPAAS